MAQIKVSRRTIWWWFLLFCGCLIPLFGVGFAELGILYAKPWQLSLLKPESIYVDLSQLCQLHHLRHFSFVFPSLCQAFCKEVERPAGFCCC